MSLRRYHVRSESARLSPAISAEHVFPEELRPTVRTKLSASKHDAQRLLGWGSLRTYF